MNALRNERHFGQFLAGSDSLSRENTFKNDR